MTNPDDKGGSNSSSSQGKDSQGSAPSWVDEVLDSSRKAPAQMPTPASPATPPADLRIPEPAPRPVPAVGSPTVAAPTMTADEDWVARATGSSAKNPSIPQGPEVIPPPTRSGLDDIEQQAKQAMTQFGQAVKSGDVSQKKLIAGLLAIVVGSFGAHKFYLGLNTPGLLLLGVNIGVWILAFLLGLLTLGIGLVFTIPLASLVSGAIGIFGLIEGLIYLTKSDADFQREYIDGKKPWL